MSDELKGRIEFLQNKINEAVEENFGYFPSADHNMCEWLDELNILRSAHGNLTALREEYVHQNKLFDAQDEIKILKIAKRELVEVIEKTLQIITDTLIYYAVFNYPEQPEIVLGEVLKAAVAKHKKE